MIRVITYDKKGLRWGSVDDIKKTRLTFVNILNPTSDEINKIAQKTKIPADEITEACDPDERPHIYEGDNHHIIIIRAPSEIGSTSIVTTPVAIIVCRNLIVCIHHKELRSINMLNDLSNPTTIKKFEQKSSHLVYSIIDEAINSYFRFVDELDDEINAIENKVYKKPDESILKKIFQIKKTLIFFHKALIANREVISNLQKHHYRLFNSKDLRFMQNTYNDVTELLDMESTYRDVLTGSLDIYLTSMSNNMNDIIKKMTAMGSFILIPTLISGIYGMNFTYMPEIDKVWGYPFALTIMVLSVVALYIYFKKKGWL